MKSSKNHNVSVVSTGIYLPDSVVTNEEIMERIKKEIPEGDPRLAKLSADWISQNIGIKERRFADFNREEKPETPINMATWALEDALKNAGWNPSELDAIVLTSISTAVSPDRPSVIPSVACHVQHNVGAWNASAYDMTAACSGFTYGATQAISYISSGMAKKVAVVSVETVERGLDYSNHVTSVIFGDAATCVLFEESQDEKVKFIHIEGNREGDDWDLITAAVPNVWGDKAPYISENLELGLKGKTVFREGTKRMTDLCNKALEASGLEKDDIQHYIFHQANGAMLMMVGGKLGLSPTQVPISLDRLANTTSCTIPSVMHDIISSGRAKRGDKMLLVSFGGGITSGAILMEY